MASLEYASVVSGGAGWTKVRTPNGRTLTIKGTRSTRNNNPGNIEYGSFARRHGAIGTDGRFAVFPTREQGFNAIGGLVFGPNYRNKTLKQAIAKYAPPFENNSTAYANKVARTVGVSLNTKMRDIPQNLRAPVAQAMATVEGRGSARVYEGGELVGRISGRDGRSTVAPGQSLEQMATEAGLYDTIMGPAGAPMEQPFPVPESSLGARASQAGLYDTIMGPAGAPSPYMPADFPVPTFSPRESAGAQKQQVPTLTPRRGPQIPVNMARPSLGGSGMPAATLEQAPQISAPTLAPRSTGPVAPTQSPHVETQAPAPELNTPPAEYLHPAFSKALPKVNARQQPPVPGLQRTPIPGLQSTPEIPASSDPYLNQIAKRQQTAPGSPDPYFNNVAKTAPMVDPIALPQQADLGINKAAQSIFGGVLPNDPVNGVYGGLYGAPRTAAYNEWAGKGPISVRETAGGVGFAGYGAKGIQGVMSGKAPAGFTAQSKSNPGYSVTSLGPAGFANTSSKFGWSEVNNPDGSKGFVAGKAPTISVDPDTGKATVGFEYGDPSKGWGRGLSEAKQASLQAAYDQQEAAKAAAKSIDQAVTAASTSPGLASLFSGLFGVQTATPGVSTPSLGLGGLFGGGGESGGSSGAGYGGANGFSGAFGGGAHSNSTDSRGL